MRSSLLLVLLFLPILAAAQSANPNTADDFAETLAAERAETDAEFLDPNESPLDPRARAAFDGLPYFAPDPAYAVSATFERTLDARPFEMATTDGTTRSYVSYGVFRFTLDGTAHALHGYRSVDAPRDSLFVPFKDATNGAETYGGGRFLDVPIPGGEKTVLDFNRAYNPYCAFSPRYTCPLPPAENWLDARIAAGEQAPPAALAEAETTPLPDVWLRLEELLDGYAASFPFEPTRTTQSESTDAGPMKTRMLTVVLGERELAVAATRLPDALAEGVGPGLFLDTVANGMLEGGEDLVRMYRTTDLGGSPGRVFHTGYGDETSYWRLYLHDKVLYQIGVIGPVEEAVREQFFDGFTFLEGEQGPGRAIRQAAPDRFRAARRSRASAAAVGLSIRRWWPSASRRCRAASASFPAPS